MSIGLGALLVVMEFRFGTNGSRYSRFVGDLYLMVFQSYHLFCGTMSLPL